MLYFTKQSLISFSMLIILSLVTGWFLVWKVKETNKQFEITVNEAMKQSEEMIKKAKQAKEVKKQQTKSMEEKVDEEKTLSLLPKNIALYEVRKNGFNLDKSLYSVNVYISLDKEEGLKKAGLLGPNASKDQYIGCWIINLQTKKAYRIAIAQRDYNFYQWIGNNEIELLSDGRATATTYDALSGDVVSTRAFGLDISADISQWKTYQSKQYGFEVKYPSGLTVKEQKESLVENLVNQYVTFYDPDNDATISLGVKNESEKNVMPRPYRTGIPEGEFFSRGIVAFGDGFAKESWFINCTFPNENRCFVEFIWFRNAMDNIESVQDDNIKLKNQKEAFMEVGLTEKSDVSAVHELIDGMIRTFQVL